MLKKIKLNLSFIMFFALVVMGAIVTLSSCAKENITYTVSFETGGSAAVEGIIFDTESGFNRLPDDPIRDGYVFSGWYTDAECTDSFDFSQAVSGDTVLYAKWIKLEDQAEEKAQVVIIFNGNGATSGKMENLRSTTDEVVVLPQNAYVREGYRFIGWGKSESDSVKHTDGGYYFVRDEQEQILYAKWSANSYLITFDKDGGKNGNDYVQATYGREPYAVSIPTRSGFVFDGYYSEKNGCGTCYYGRDGNGVNTWNIANDIKLYAHWKSADLNIIFDGNGATDGSTEGMNVNAGEEVTLNENGFLKTGYSFVGWSLERDGELIHETDNRYSVPYVDGDLTLYCIWKPNTYFIEYYFSTESNQSFTERTIYAADYAVAVNRFIRQGYAFAGWTDSDGTTVRFNGGETVTNLTAEENGVVKLYAIWRAREYCITLNASGGIGGTENIKVTYDGLFGFAIAPHKTGYDFGGYYLQPDGQGSCYYNENMVAVDRYVIANDAEIFAKWMPKDRAVSFDLNGGSGQAPETIDSKTEENVFIHSTKFSKVGYDFSGWCEDESGLGKIFNDNYKVSASDQDIVLYAIWSPKLLMIIFDGNGGSGETENISAHVNDVIRLPACGYTLKGYLFEGWRDEESVVFTESFTVPATDGDITLCADWEIIYYNMIYELDGGVNSDNNPLRYCVTDGIIMLDSPVKKGYDFRRWSEGNELVIEDIENLSDLTFHAEWSIIYYNIFYDLQRNVDNPNDGITQYTVEDEIVFAQLDCNGFTFLGWSGGGFIPKGSIGDITLTAYWSGDVYKITYVLGKGYNDEGNPETYQYDDQFEIRPASCTGYEFIDWIDQYGKRVTAIEAHSMGDLFLTAQWQVIQYNISYDIDEYVDNRENPATYTVEDEIILQNPLKPGYTFDKWSGEGKIVLGSTGDKRFTANWEIIRYSIIYFDLQSMDEETGSYNLSQLDDSCIGQLPKSYTIEDVREHALLIGAPIIPNNDMEFDCWLLYNKAFNEIPIGSIESLSLIANWKFDITYVDGGDKNDNPTFYTTNQMLTLNQPKKSGYEFLRWEDDNQNTVEMIPMCSRGSIKLTAVWQTVEYNITYEFDGGKCDGTKDTYTVEEEFELPLPTKNGYQFLGWMNEQGKLVTSIKKGNYGDLKFTAIWEKDSSDNTQT